MLFELLVFAYMNGIYSSRGIEKACKTHIRFMWILQNEPVPDHSTFARFQDERLTSVIEDLFYQLTEKLYELGEIAYLENMSQNAYIKPQDYEVRKTRKFKNNAYRTENLLYDDEKDCFVCPNGKRLNFAYESHRKSENGYETVKRNYVCENCSGCPYREKCFKGQYENRKISFSKNFVRQKENATKLITTREGILLRMNRSIQVEGAFGVLKQDYGFRRFLTRGKQKTETQFFLLSIAFNIQKLWNRCNSGRFNNPLFEKMIS